MVTLSGGNAGGQKVKLSDFAKDDADGERYAVVSGERYRLDADGKTAHYVGRAG